MDQKKWLTYLMALMAMLFWGISYVWTKIVFDFYQPVTIMFIRLCIATLFLYLIIAFTRGIQPVNRRDIPSFVMLSFFSPFCYFLGENYGLLHVSPTVAAVIIASIPLFAPLLGFLAFKEKLSVVNISGFIISFSGIWIMVLDQDFRFSASPLGILLLFFAVASALANLVYLKKLSLRYSPFTIIFVQNALGALFFMPVFFVFEFREFLEIKPSAPALASLLALAVFGSTLAFVFYTAAVKSLGIAKTSIFGNLIPVFTALTSLIILNEIIDTGKLAGMIMVITGLLFTQLSVIRKRMRTPEQPTKKKPGPV